MFIILLKFKIGICNFVINASLYRLIFWSNTIVSIILYLFINLNCHQFKLQTHMSSMVCTTIRHIANSCCIFIIIVIIVIILSSYYLYFVFVKILLYLNLNTFLLMSFFIVNMFFFLYFHRVPGHADDAAAIWKYNAKQININEILRYANLKWKRRKNQWQKNVALHGLANAKNKKTKNVLLNDKKKT